MKKFLRELAIACLLDIPLAIACVLLSMTDKSAAVVVFIFWLFKLDKLLTRYLQ